MNAATSQLPIPADWLVDEATLEDDIVETARRVWNYAGDWTVTVEPGARPLTVRESVEHYKRVAALNEGIRRWWRQ